MVKLRFMSMFNFRVTPEDGTIKISTPQFRRIREVEKFKKPNIDFKKWLYEKTKYELYCYGFEVWENYEDGKDLMLFPYEFYNYIPNGFKCINISGDEFEFVKGISDSGVRCGCLAYGIKK